MTELTDWLDRQLANYEAALGKVNRARQVLLDGDASRAGELLKNSYVFAVLSIRTHVEQHEAAFTQWVQDNGIELREAINNVQYPNQKADWIEKTLNENDFEVLALAVREHRDAPAQLLDVITENLTGVSYRKAAFMLAMSGLHQYLCIDSHMAEKFGFEDSEDKSLEFYSGNSYLEACAEITSRIDLGKVSLPPFLKQWVEWDRIRGEHSTHQTFYHHAIGHGINPRKDLGQ